MTEGEIREVILGRYEPLRTVLRQHANDIVQDLTPLEGALLGLQVRLGNPLEWHLALHNLTLRLPDPPRGTYPSGCDPFFVRLSYECRVQARGSGADELFGQISVLETQIELEGIREIGHHRAAWHLDLHPYGRGASIELHPRTHWQHGGRAARTWNSDVGNWVLTAAPRIPTPPLDLALVIGWLLGHFVPAHWEYIKEFDTSITQLLRLQQSWLWEPYFRRVYSHWTEEPDPTRFDWWPELA